MAVLDTHLYLIASGAAAGRCPYRAALADPWSCGRCAPKKLMPMGISFFVHVGCRHMRDGVTPPAS